MTTEPNKTQSIAGHINEKYGLRRLGFIVVMESHHRKYGRLPICPDELNRVCESQLSIDRFYKYLNWYKSIAKQWGLPI